MNEPLRMKEEQQEGETESGERENEDVNARGTTIKTKRENAAKWLNK